MNKFFQRQLTDYVEYHRDPRNCALHVVGIVFLFLAAVLPLSAWSVTAFGVQTSAATIAVVPVLIYWLLLDGALGAAILGAAVVLLSAAALIVRHVGSAGMWSITIVLIVAGVASQIVGHRIFERTYDHDQIALRMVVQSLGKRRAGLLALRPHRTGRSDCER